MKKSLFTLNKETSHRKFLTKKNNNINITYGNVKFVLICDAQLVSRIEKNKNYAWNDVVYNKSQTVLNIICLNDLYLTDFFVFPASR